MLGAMRIALAVIFASLVASSCTPSHPPDVAASSADGAGAGGACTALFGVPNEHTGLTPVQCQPQCGCGADAYAPPAYDAAFVQSLIDGWNLVTPYPPLASNPYDQPAPAADPPDTVCGVLEQAGARDPTRSSRIHRRPSRRRRGRR